MASKRATESNSVNLEMPEDRLIKQGRRLAVFRQILSEPDPDDLPPRGHSVTMPANPLKLLRIKARLFHAHERRRLVGDITDAISDRILEGKLQARAA